MLPNFFQNLSLLKYNSEIFIKILWESDFLINDSISDKRTHFVVAIAMKSNQ